MRSAVFSSLFLAAEAAALPLQDFFGEESFLHQLERRQNASVAFYPVPPDYVMTQNQCRKADTIQNPSFESASQGTGGTFGTLDHWRLFPIDGDWTGAWYLDGTVSFPDAQAGLGNYPASASYTTPTTGTGYTSSGGFSLGVDIGENQKKATAVGLSQHISVCPNTAYTLNLYYAATENTLQDSTGVVPTAWGLSNAACTLSYGMSPYQLPFNFTSPAINTGTAWNNTELNSFYGNTGVLGPSGGNFILATAAIPASVIGPATSIYVQVVLDCTTILPGGNAAVFVDNFFLT